MSALDWYVVGTLGPVFLVQLVLLGLALRAWWRWRGYLRGNHDSDA